MNVNWLSYHGGKNRKKSNGDHWPPLSLVGEVLRFRDGLMNGWNLSDEVEDL